MESHLVTVVLRPSAAALSRVVSVLHARGADVSRLAYDRAEIVIETSGPEVERLAAQLRRLIDVTDVSVSPVTPATVLAVAS